MDGREDENEKEGGLVVSPRCQETHGEQPNHVMWLVECGSKGLTLQLVLHGLPSGITENMTQGNMWQI